MNVFTKMSKFFSVIALLVLSHTVVKADVDVISASLTLAGSPFTINSPSGANTTGATEYLGVFAPNQVITLSAASFTTGYTVFNGTGNVCVTGSPSISLSGAITYSATSFSSITGANPNRTFARTGPSLATFNANAMEGTYFVTITFVANASGNPTGSGCASILTTTFTFNFVYDVTAALPVELVSFKGTPKNDKVQLAWQTASEIDHDLFDVQRSKDGVKWVSLSKIKGAGKSEILRDYNFTDLTPSKGVNLYRLREVSTKGVVTYSKVISVEMMKGKSDATFSVFPNPAKNTLTIMADATDADITVMDLAGRVVLRNNNTQTVDISNLVSGMYIVRLMTKDGELMNKQFIKE